MIDIINFKLFFSSKVENKLLKLLKIYENKTLPELKIGANILMSKYKIPEGKILGNKLKLIEETWLNSENLKIKDKSLVWNTDLLESLEYKNLIAQAVVTMNSAHNRKESRGAHAREDFKERDDKNWMKHTLSWLDEERCKLEYRSVHEYTLSNEVKYIEPKARVY